MKKQFKKILAITLATAMLIGASGCGQKTGETNANAGDTQAVNMLEQIKQNGKLVVGTSPDYPPFEFIVSENGESKIVGADIDLAQKLADKMGVELEIKPMDFDSLLPALQSGVVDILITGMTPDEKRRESVDFTDIYFKSTNAIIVKAEDVDKIKSESDLKSIKIGVQKGSTQEVYVKDKLQNKEFKSLKTIPDLIFDLKNGNIDAIILNDSVAGINVLQYEGIAIVPNVALESGGDEENMAIALKKGENKELLELMNAEIKSLQDSGEYAKILASAVELASKTEQ